eukprot:sb/3477834/
MLVHPQINLFKAVLKMSHRTVSAQKSDSPWPLDPVQTTSEQLTPLFQQFGPCEVKVIRDKNSGISKGFWRHRRNIDTWCDRTRCLCHQARVQALKFRLGDPRVLL